MALRYLVALAIVLIAFWGVTLWKAARNEARSEAAYPPIGDFLTVDGHRVHFVQMGNGPDVVLIHGASGNVRDMTFSLAGKLADHYRVTVFDRPGLGYSDRINTTGATITDQAAVLAQASAQLGLTRPLVVGQSYGGAVALAWGVTQTDNLSALVLLAPAAKPWETGLSTYYKITSSWLGARLAVPVLTAWVPDSVVDTALQDIFAPQTAPAGYGAYIGTGLTLRRVSLRANAAQRANLLSEIEALHDRYGEIDVPVEILHGDADTTVGLHIHSVPLSQQIEGANLTTLPGIGHMPQHVAEPQVIQAIDRAASRAGLR
ncbi:alpha/beta fold hydrolase [Pseudoprimorskyibacter insulae]|uniref:Haloalkane dehalogenase 2 n=1 Tax=Pseudoprimorskyibacter insulae TaxID=1695997 RepID=A0A2R8AWM4_9RHOB|nr:alpha/beta hydrolase [Pseudoprimorskyibacter insulae]SPF80442.1 Haloalkane dehalogenase 2 [Pseudoprimorskyibacter insulae]